MNRFNYPLYPDLKNKTVLISGGGSGIGASFVEAFAVQGSEVAFLDIQEKVSKKLVKKLTSKGPEPLFVKCDLTDIEALKKAVSEVKNLLVLGGSLGAKKINEVIPHIKTPVNIWHQTGKSHFDEVKALYSKSDHHQVKLDPFISNMSEAYAWADLVVCRAGAMTVSELIATKTIAILIPFPYAIDNHQTVNAQYLSNNGAGILIEEKDLSSEVIDKEISQLNTGKLNEMSNSLSSLKVQHPEQLIADYLLN